MRHAVVCGTIVIVAALACGGSRSPGDQPGDPAAPAAPGEPAGPQGKQHLLLVVRMADHRLDVVSARIVPVPLPLDRAPPAASPDAWHVELLDATGASRVATDLPPADIVRGEFAGSDGSIEGHRVTPAVTEFLVRFPVTPEAASIVISTGATGGVRAARREIGRAPLPAVTGP